MSDTPRTDAEELRQYEDEDGNPIGLWRLVKNEPEWAVNQIRHRDKLERELNAANERIKQLEADAYNSTQKIQRLEGWNTQNCADKVNLMETIRHREGWVERLIKAGEKLCVRRGDNESIEEWDALVKRPNDSSATS